ncbi:MAG: tetratricopeptide repeat protein [Candidatus Babeliales bacterium]
MKSLLYALIFSLGAHLCAMNQGPNNHANLKKAGTESATLALADEHYTAGRYAQAKEVFEIVLERATTTNELYKANQALADLHAHRLPKAPENVEMAFNYYINALKVLEALEQINTKEVCLPHRAALLRNLTKICFESGKLAQAISYGTQSLAIESHPIIIAPLCHMIGVSTRSTDAAQSKLYLERGVNALLQAVNNKEQILEATPEAAQLYGQLHKELGNTLFTQKQFKEAEVNYKKGMRFLQAMGDKADIWVQMGLLYQRDGKKLLARANFECAAEEHVKSVNERAYNAAKAWLAKHP